MGKPGRPPAMASQIELWPLERLKPFERNARTHSDEQVHQIVRSIEQFGFLNPILVDSDDGILAGHGRLMAAKRLQLAQVPVVVLDHLSEAQRRAFILADNQIASNAGWDMELLRGELLDLRVEGFDWGELGFDGELLGELFVPPADEQQLEDEEAPPDDTGPERGMPLAIVLEPSEMREWREVKQQLGYSRDKAALLKLMTEYLNQTRAAA